MSLSLRTHPLGATPADLWSQWIGSANASTRGAPRISLLRTVREDPAAQSGLPFIGALPTRDLADLEAAWAEAQLAADATMLGLALGLRVALIPEGRCWFAELLIIRTGGHLRLGRRHPKPSTALVSARRSLISTLGEAKEPADPLPVSAGPRRSAAAPVR